MMIKKILTIGAAVAAAAAGTSLAQAQQSYPVPPGAVYSAAPGYPPGGYVVDERRTPLPPDFDELEDDDAPNGPASTALPTPGPVLSPSDPRYGRPVYSNVPPPAPTGPILSPDDPRYGRPAYSNVQPPAPTGPILSPDDPRYGRPAYSAAPPSAPTGPVMSPDDPRYGRPAGPPAVIYGDRPPGSAPAATYNDDALRPPGAIGAAPAVTGALPQQPQVGADGRPVQLSALPPEEQPEVGPAQLPPHLRRQEVAFATKEPAGTIVVDTSNTYLYYVLGNGRAMRYGVRVGREGFTWTGVQKITKKTEWPDWHPPTEMIERQPYLPRFMAGGPGNPLGARAMYLGSTVYRIHGTNQPSTIGKFVSSGCIGMLNEDVSDLFERTKVGTRVVVMPGGPPPGVATAAATQPAAGTTTAAAGAPVAAAPPARVSGSAVGQGPAVVPPLPPATTIR